MSTREMALSIFNRLSEKQLEGFIAMFNGIVDENEDNNSTQEERDAAFERIISLCRYIPDFDEKKELAAYRDKRFSV